MGKSVETVYGEALYAYAREHGQTEAFEEEVSAMEQILRENPEFTGLMLHPRLSGKEKQALLEKIFSGRASSGMMGFLRLMEVKGHFGQLPGIFERYRQCYRKEQGIGVVQISSARELTDAQKEQILNRLSQTTSYKTLRPEYQVDPGLIGGVVIRIGDRVADGSVKNKLDRMKKQLLDMQLASDK